jgi:hypothetical protein
MSKARNHIHIRRSLALVAVALVVGAAMAAPGQASPIAITQFEMQTIEGTSETQLPGERSEFVNKPYVFTQAGGHPWGLVTTLEFASEEVENVEKLHLVIPTREPKDVVVDLPPGLLGNPMAVPQCPLQKALVEGTCPPATQVGVYRVVWFGGKEGLFPIVNVTPEAGQSAEFAFEGEVKLTPVLTGHLVRSGEGYSLSVASNTIPLVELVRLEATFWGVPADPSHDFLRGRFCGKTERTSPGLICKAGRGNESAGIGMSPFLTMPTNCSAGAEKATVRADSWQEPGSVEVNGKYRGYAERQTSIPAATGCNVLTFDPAIEISPDTLLADEPVGLGVDLSVPLNEKPLANATPQLRNSVLTLPEGVSVSPGVVDGIRACDEFGPEGINITGPESEEIGLNGEWQLAPGHCPDASSVGTAEAFTPLLPGPVAGHIYLARPGCGGAGQHPCTEKDAVDGTLYRLYLELGGTGELAKTGVHFKVAFQTQANPATGQLTTKVLGTPQVPFNDLKVHLNGGPRAPLDTPATCGPAVSTADFTPWSAPGLTPQGLLVSGTPDALPSSYFEVGGCAQPSLLRPGFAAGTVTAQATRFTPFTLTLSRQDREQFVKGIQVHTPPGLLGMLSRVPLCGEPQADAGTCTESSKIGTTRVASGAGSHPFEISGNVYLTGPYQGSPFGLSVVTNAVAGPFNLGLVVVRAHIDVDPQTSTLRVTTDEAGPHAIPQVLFGVPLRLQRITVDIDRPEFMFNPTNCSKQKITGLVSGSEQALATVESSFAVGGCKSLKFEPRFSVSTSAHTNRRSGASLDAKLTYPANAFGNDANIAKVKVSLPRQLPSRLTTLQKACPAATFERDPAACPGGAIVGIVRATTPVLPTRLEGPVYFVSHGGEAFPSLVVVLEGEGVRVDLTGTTFISKAGVTSSTFKTLPDVPVRSFELYLPQGLGSALAANGDLCRARSSLVMPITFVAQNGAEIKKRSTIKVLGCPAKKRRSKSKAHK